MSNTPKRRLLIIFSGGLALCALVLTGILLKVSLDTEILRKAAAAEESSRITSLEQKVVDLEKTLADDLLTLQDRTFEQLKKNDGLTEIWTDPTPGRRAYLTFDDGPSEFTAQVLDALKAKKIHATFFVNGRPPFAPLYQRIAKEGHQLGNHTWSHDYNLIYASTTAFLADVDKLDAFLASLDLPPSKLYRFPGGAKNEFAAKVGGPDMTSQISSAMADRGYRFYEWNVAVGEGESRPGSRMFAPADIRKSVDLQVKNKRIAVILLHDGPGHKETALAVPGIIDDLKKMGFTFEVLP